MPLKLKRGEIEDLRFLKTEKRRIEEKRGGARGLRKGVGIISKRGKERESKSGFRCKDMPAGEEEENQKYHISFPQCIYRTAAMIALVRMTITNALTHRQGPPTSPWP